MASAMRAGEGPCCSGRGASAEAQAGVALIGNANVGKSALFGALTGTYTTVSNYPGTTVEVASGTVVCAAGRFELIDTPGTASLLPCSEDERVTRDILLSGRARVAIVVGDAKNLERALLLAVQLAETEIPHVLCLNMMDEAAARGVTIDVEALAGRLGVAVVPTAAIQRCGIDGLRASLAAARGGSVRVSYPPPVERAIAVVAPLLPEAPVAPRALALMVLGGDDGLTPWLHGRATPAARAAIQAARVAVHDEIPDPLPWVITRARLQAAAGLALGLTRRPAPARPRSLLERIEPLTIHRVWGLPILAVVLGLAYAFVGVFGARTLVDLLEQGLFGRWINPAAVALAERFVPWAPLRELLVGPYGLVTMALAYSLALVLPIVTTFFIAFGVLEDSGYLPRLAVLLNRAFKGIGLNGKAVLPMVLGLGCDTMATLTTRMLDTPKERLIVILLLALGVPCSAQLTVVFAMLAGLPAAALLVWLAVVLGVVVLVGRLAARVLPGTGSDFVLELPPLRLPRARNLAVKTVARVEWYLREAVPLFLLGTAILFAADRLQLLGGVQRAAEPLLTGLLGLPRETAEAFVVGFLRRDFGAAGLYRLAREGRLDAVQSLVAVVTITLFVPCIAQFFMMVKERGWRTALAIAAFVFPFAFGAGAALNRLLAAVPLGLR